MLCVFLVWMKDACQHVQCNSSLRWINLTQGYEILNTASTQTDNGNYDEVSPKYCNFPEAMLSQTCPRRQTILNALLFSFNDRLFNYVCPSIITQTLHGLVNLQLIKQLKHSIPVLLYIIYSAVYSIYCICKIFIWQK